MKILLTAINAKYIHSNLALLCLKSYAGKYKDSVEIAEYTINNYTDFILGDIYKKNPDFIGFSCYIWNISMIKELAIELHKVLPHTKIWLGGPEVSYDAKKCLEESPYLEGIMVGEGEKTFLELMDYYLGDRTSLQDIRGIVYREQETGIVVENSPQPLLDLSALPFPYENLDAFKNKIIYYETSRGCPYSCSYCLSSTDKSVRLRSIELVKKELQFFLDYKIPQVKFIDRTFNCNRNHAMAIWSYIHEHDNGITNFHFEISADLIKEDELKRIGTFREGLIQLEIGVQSTNPKTIEAIHRRMDLDKLTYAVERIYEKRNIHQHLDLIVGLPYENYQSFRKSFNDVYAMKPDQLQLGFLKVLKGSSMYEDSRKYNIVYQNIAPYEVLFTDWISYDQVLELKKIEDMVEVYYNSGQFANGITYLEHFFDTPFDMYKELGDYYERKNLHNISHSRLKRYDILLCYFRETRSENAEGFQEILLYDLYLREKLKSRPSFAKENCNFKEQLKSYGGGKKGRQIHIEPFSIDIKAAVDTGILVKKEHFVLFDYDHRHPLNKEAETTILPPFI